MEGLAIVHQPEFQLDYMAAGKSHTNWPRISQRCSIGDRSGNMDSQSKVLTRLACKQFLSILQVWAPALSYWKTKLFPTVW